MPLINNPTKISNVLVENILHAYAAKGAANNPPRIKPDTTCQMVSSTRIKSDVALASVRKNSAKFTEPIVVRGS